MDLPLASSRLMRRIATVTIPAPLASCAACMTAIVGYFPVPTISREVSRCSPRIRTSFTLSTRDRFDNFDPIAVDEFVRFVIAAAYHALVFGDRNPIARCADFG